MKRLNTVARVRSRYERASFEFTSAVRFTRARFWFLEEAADSICENRA